MNETFVVVIDKCAAVALFSVIVTLIVATVIGVRRGKLMVRLGEGDVREARPFLRWMTASAVLVGSGVFLSFLVVFHARSLLYAKTDQAGNPLLVINGQQVPNATGLLSSLRAMKSGACFSSGRSTRIPVEIQSGKETLRLELIQDSKRTGEYCVFVPKYWVTSNNGIGRIREAVLDDI